MRVSPAVQETATSSPVAHSAAQSSLLYRGRAWILAIPFLAPAIIFYTLFLIVPLVGTLLLSLTEWSGFNFADIRFVGLENFRLMGRDEIFWLSLRHNLIFLGGAVALKTTVALALALALEQRIPFTNLFRGVFLMPTVISLVVVGEGLVTATLLYLAFINVLLALFNLVPAAPLDGGRVLRAAVWKATGDRARAAVVAARAGRFFGLALIVLGIGGALLWRWFGGLWLALIGFFLVNAAMPRSRR